MLDSHRGLFVGLWDIVHKLILILIIDRTGSLFHLSNIPPFLTSSGGLIILNVLTVVLLSIAYPPLLISSE